MRKNEKKREQEFFAHSRAHSRAHALRVLSFHSFLFHNQIIFKIIYKKFGIIKKMNIYTFNLLFFLPLSVTFYFELSRSLINKREFDIIFNNL